MKREREGEADVFGNMSLPARTEQCIAITDKAFREFKANCGHGTAVKPTPDGLHILAEATSKLSRKRTWSYPKVRIRYFNILNF